MDPLTPNPVLAITAWQDPVIDTQGFGSASQYVELCWLPVLGPTATWMWRRLAAGLSANPAGYRLELLELARWLGVGCKGGRHSPAVGAVERLIKFGAAQGRIVRSDTTGAIGDTELRVRRYLAPLSLRQVERLPATLQRAHHGLVAKHQDLLARQRELAAAS